MKRDVTVIMKKNLNGIREALPTSAACLAVFKRPIGSSIQNVEQLDHPGGLEGQQHGATNPEKSPTVPAKLNMCCLSPFSVSKTQYHQLDKLQRKRFIFAYDSCLRQKDHFE